jgi:hypothetical protein
LLLVADHGLGDVIQFSRSSRGRHHARRRSRSLAAPRPARFSRSSRRFRRCVCAGGRAGLALACGPGGQSLVSGPAPVPPNGAARLGRAGRAGGAGT